MSSGVDGFETAARLPVRGRRVSTLWRDGLGSGTGSSLVLVVWAVAPPLQTGGWVCDLKSLSCCAAGLRVGVRYRSGGDPGA